jgi:hypothetical protein
MLLKELDIDHEPLTEVDIDEMGEIRQKGLFENTYLYTPFDSTKCKPFKFLRKFDSISKKEKLFFTYETLGITHSVN